MKSLKLSVAVSLALCFGLTACGGGGDSAEPPVTEPPVTEPPVTEPPVTEPPVTEPPVSDNKSAYTGIISASTNLVTPQFINPIKSAIQKTARPFSSQTFEIGQCNGFYNGLVDETTWNTDTDLDGIADLNITDTNDNLSFNIDLDGDLQADINIITESTYRYLNIDTNCNGSADVNMTEKNGIHPKINIDTNGDFVADINIDIDGDLIPDLNIDTDGDLIADTSIDIDGDGIPDFSYTDTGGLLLIGAMVTLEGDFGTYTAETSEDGTFKFEAIETGYYSLTSTYKTYDGSTLWAKKDIFVAKESSINTFRVHRNPLIESVTINDNKYDANYQTEVHVSSSIIDPLSVGDTLKIKIIAEDPNSLQLSAFFGAHLGDGFTILDDNSESLEISYTIKDLDKSRPSLHFIADINNDDDEFGMDGSRDAFVSFYLPMADYKEDTPPELTSVVIDGIEYINTDNLDYFQINHPDKVKLGDIVNIQVNAQHPDNLPLDGRFDHQTVSGGYKTIEGFEFSYEFDDTVKFYTHSIGHWTLNKEGSNYQDPIELQINFDTDTEKQGAIINSITLNNLDPSAFIGRVGETIEIKVNAIDPNGGHLECQITKSGNWDFTQEEAMLSDWSENCQIPYTFVKKDNVEDFNFRVWVRNDDGFYTYNMGKSDTKRFSHVQVIE